ncbi:DNA-binding transcriptional LysR family regulator [Paenibacillus phyllosphaerae]|uniref:DNA-binding transcriptional LysR family regulator n=1 Tax=Paenibacillus phyllosphaerae TaxID=274593 RepID=A0A7W5B2R4_9BACL|nr:LysR family transcriptional regulator [Paenibacillus phyllosphaerae]MBB3112566.1 DNA-binding transcriptional LysR family regulator [Paenibacillus phyllosphaerae]
MKTFMEVARCHSFTKAAENLGYVQSSVTTHIQKLENEYGVVLFERFGRSMRLTSAGEQLHIIFDQILTLYDESKHVFSRQIKGNLIIGTIESMVAFFLPPVFHRFRQSFPQINLQVRPLTELQVLQGVKSGELDVGVTLDTRCNDDDVNHIFVREEPIILVAAPNHALFREEPLEIAELFGQSYIATEKSCNYRCAFERLLTKHGVDYHIHNEFGSLEAIKQCVGFGLGIGLLPQIAVSRELEEGRLVQLPFRHPEITFHTQIVHHKRKWLDPAIRHFMDLVQEQGTDLPQT